MVPVQRAEMITRDLDVIAELINQQYVEHQAEVPLRRPRLGGRGRAVGHGRDAGGCCSSLQGL